MKTFCYEAYVCLLRALLVSPIAMDDALLVSLRVLK